MEAKLLPQCVGFIMDGNRRWAVEQNLSPLAGHVQGEKIFTEVIEWAKEKQIPQLVFYAFSTENWRRSDAEVAHLMQLFEGYLRKVMPTLKQNQVRIRMLGQRSHLPESLVRLITQAESLVSVEESIITVWVTLSYGGRGEIVEAVNAAIKLGQPVTEASLQSHMWGAELPEPDMIIRTGGEQRLSNFLLWHIAYSELFFTNTFWPAFTKAEFLRIVDEYGKRQRRHGV